MMHGAVALTDAVQNVVHGNVRGALEALGRPGVAYSLRSLASDSLPRMAFSLPGAKGSIPADDRLCVPKPS